jgi:predicted PurR-regulated permease PerM
MSLSEYINTYIVKNQLVVAVLVIVTGWIMWHIRHIIIVAFVAFVFQAAALPAVRHMTKRGLPRIIASLAPILAFLMLFLLLIIPLSTISLEQAQEVFDRIILAGEETANLIPLTFIPENIADSLSGYIGNVGSLLLQIPGTIAGFLVSVFLMLFTAFYLLLDHDKIVHTISRLFPKRRQVTVKNRIQYVETTVGNWVLGQLLVAAIVGVVTYIAYSIIGLPFAITLAYFALLMELIPNIGPFLAITPALLVAFTISPLTAVYTLVAFSLIQTLESYILVPKVTQTIIGLHPLVVVFSIIIGSSFFGFIGALIAVPFAATITAIATYKDRYVT